MEMVLVNLANFHYEMRFIGLNEYGERVDMALWLSDDYPSSIKDPRAESEEELYINEQRCLDNYHGDLVGVVDNNANVLEENLDYSIKFIFLKTWIFTKSDRDSYPSIPHGHFKSQNNKWPKLNPYTGRVYSSKESEDKQQRLSKSELNQLWNDEKFRSFCREMIVWYRENFPYYEFSVMRPFRLPRRRS